MDDLRAVVKELHRIADAGERIAKALEKQNKIINISPQVCFNADSDIDKIKKWTLGAMEDTFKEVIKET